MKTQALPGFRDFYPDDLALRAHIFRTWRSVATRYGFEEYDGPPLESLELYTAKSGDEIVGQLYSFKDKGDRDVALRPEMTPSLARMVASRSGRLKKPIRWFSIPQLFRYERQQRGRLREHFQLNCDLIGEASPLADAEIIALAIDVVRGFGLGPNDVRVRLSDRRLLTAMLQARGIAEASLPKAFEFLDKIERRRKDPTTGSSSPGELGKSAIADLEEIASIRGWEMLESYARKTPSLAKTAEPLREAYRALEGMGLGTFVDVDLTIVRGLAYYTGIVFELFDAGRTLRAICGGGRYDNLLGALGSTELPAVGFGMGDVVLAELLKNKGLVPSEIPGIDVFVAFISQDDVPYVLALAHELREAGLRVEYALGPQAVGKQMNLADARHASVAVVVGPDERARGETVIRDLRTGAQDTVPSRSLVDTIKVRIHGRSKNAE